MKVKLKIIFANLGADLIREMPDSGIFGNAFIPVLHIKS